MNPRKLKRKKKLKKFIVSRTYCERWRWKVEAESHQAALEMLDCDGDTPSGDLLDSELADKEWLGPVKSNSISEIEDGAIEIP